MKNISLIGAPGSGKSTQLKRLMNQFKSTIPIFYGKITNLMFLDDSVKPYLTEEETNWLEVRMEQSRKDKRLGDLASIEYDQLLFEATKRLPENHIVVFDGSPRSFTRAELFLKQEHLVNESLVIHLTFPEYDFEHSISRQFFRGIKSRGFDYAKTEFDRFQRKYEIYQTDTLKGIELLRNNGVPIKPINPLNTMETIEMEIRDIFLKHIQKDEVN